MFRDDMEARVARDISQEGETIIDWGRSTLHVRTYTSGRLGVFGVYMRG